MNTKKIQGQLLQRKNSFFPCGWTSTASNHRWLCPERQSAAGLPPVIPPMSPRILLVLLLQKTANLLLCTQKLPLSFLVIE